MTLSIDVYCQRTCAIHSERLLSRQKSRLKDFYSLNDFSFSYFSN